MRIKKTIISLFLSVCMCFSMTVGVSASNENVADAPLYTSYTDFCDDYYSSHQLYRVYDKNGADISAFYYATTVAWYEDNNIAAIYEYMIENVSRYQKIEVIGNINAKGAIQTVTKTETFVGFVDNSTISDFEIVYTLSGTFTYNVNTGKIASYYSPTINLTHVGISNMVSGAMANASTSAKKTADGYSVIFEGHFDIVTTQYLPLGFASVPLTSETTGPYTASFVAYGT